MASKIEIKTTEHPCFQRGPIWYLATILFAGIILGYLLSRADYIGFSAFLIVFVLYYFYNLRSQNRTIKFSLSPKKVAIGQKKISWENLASFCLLKKRPGRPLVLILRGRGMSQSIPLPANKSTAVLEFISKKLPLAPKPFFLDSWCYFLKI